MEKRVITAFVSFGFSCGGPEMGGYGKFEVALTNEEWAKIDNIINNRKKKGYIREELAQLYPEIDAKIREAGNDLILEYFTDECLSESHDYMEDIESVIINDIKSNDFYYSDSVDFENMEEEEYNRIVGAWEEWERELVFSKKGDDRLAILKQRDYIDEEVTMEDLGCSLCYYLTDEEIPGDY